MLDANDYMLEEKELINAVKEKEDKIIKESQNEDPLKYSDPGSLKIYKKVLKAAWKWQDEISPHEQNILDVLQEELGLSVYEHRILESKLGYFPQANNQIHGIKIIKSSLKDLQYRGLIARIRDDECYFVIPQEIAENLRHLLGVELRKNEYLLLLEELKKSQLQKIVRKNNLPIYGTKEEVYNRILQARIKPSEALNVLTSNELTDLLRGLEEVNISGTKEEKIENIIDFYSRLITYTVETGDERENYYNYIVELAQRNYEQLRGNNIISKDLDIEHYFEKATEFLFEILLNHNPQEMTGKDNPDGKLIFNDNEVVLWDNKSCENEYKFPEEDYIQFMRYINKERSRVNLFLVIAPSFSREAIKKAPKLKAESRKDTDVGLITAEEIKFVADNWQEYCSTNSSFSLQVFNYTGRLTKNRLKERMEWALN